jgi:hypothetical protein
MNRHERRRAAKLGEGMTTFWLAFTDPEASADKRFLGVRFSTWTRATASSR